MCLGKLHPSLDQSAVGPKTKVLGEGGYTMGGRSTKRVGSQTNFQEMQQHIRSNNLESLSLCNAMLCALTRFSLVNKKPKIYVEFLKVAKIGERTEIQRYIVSWMQFATE